MSDPQRPAARLDLGQAILRATRDGLLVRDRDGSVLDVNDALCRLIGLGRDELIGEGPPHAYWPADERTRLSADVDRAIRGEIVEGDSTFLTRDGGRVDVSLCTVPLLADNGERVGCLTTVVDVTARRRAD